MNQNSAQGIGVAAGEDYVVVADGGGEEVGGEAYGRQDDLGAAELAFVAVARQLALLS